MRVWYSDFGDCVMFCIFLVWLMCAALSLRCTLRHLSGVSNLFVCVRFVLHILQSNLWHLWCVPKFIFVSFVLRALLDHALALQHPLFAAGSCLSCPSCLRSASCWLWQLSPCDVIACMCACASGVMISVFVLWVVCLSLHTDPVLFLHCVVFVRMWVYFVCFLLMRAVDSTLWCPEGLWHNFL